MNEIQNGPSQAVVADERVRYYYFGRRVFPVHQGIVTAGAIVVPATDDTPEMLRVAFAYCSPSDIFRRRSSGIEYRRKITHTSDGETKSERVEVVIYGGLDIVNSRLGLCPIEAYPEQQYAVQRMSKSVIEDVMATFNGIVPAEDKPRLWQSRKLALAARGVQIMSYCRHYHINMNIGWELLDACQEKLPGFIYEA